MNFQQLFSGTQESSNVEPPKDYVQVSQMIAKCLRDKDYAAAVKLVRRVDVVNRDARIEMAFEHQVGYYAVLLRSYLFLGEDHVSVFFLLFQNRFIVVY